MNNEKYSSIFFTTTQNGEQESYNPVDFNQKDLTIFLNTKEHILSVFEHLHKDIENNNQDLISKFCKTFNNELRRYSAVLNININKNDYARKMFDINLDYFNHICRITNSHDNKNYMVKIINQIGGIEKITDGVDLSKITIKDLNLDSPSNEIGFNDSGDLKKNSMVKN